MDWTWNDPLKDQRLSMRVNILDRPTKIFVRASQSSGITTKGTCAHFKDATFLATKKKVFWNSSTSFRREVLCYFRAGPALHSLINLSFSLAHTDFKTALQSHITIQSCTKFYSVFIVVCSWMQYSGWQPLRCINSELQRDRVQKCCS